MKIAIMQPYFLPYIGYWQLIAAVDAFVVYDNIKGLVQFGEKNGEFALAELNRCYHFDD